MTPRSQIDDSTTGQVITPHRMPSVCLLMRTIETASCTQAPKMVITDHTRWPQEEPPPLYWYSTGESNWKSVHKYKLHLPIDKILQKLSKFLRGIWTSNGTMIVASHTHGKIGVFQLISHLFSVDFCFTFVWFYPTICTKITANNTDVQEDFHTLHVEWYSSTAN